MPWMTSLCCSGSMSGSAGVVDREVQAVRRDRAVEQMVRRARVRVAEFVVRIAQRAHHVLLEPRRRLEATGVGSPISRLHGSFFSGSAAAPVSRRAGAIAPAQREAAPQQQRGGRAGRCRRRVQMCSEPRVRRRPVLMSASPGECSSRPLRGKTLQWRWEFAPSVAHLSSGAATLLLRCAWKFRARRTRMRRSTDTDSHHPHRQPAAPGRRGGAAAGRTKRQRAPRSTPPSTRPSPM